MNEINFEYINKEFNTLKEFFAFYKISKTNIYILIQNKCIKVNDNVLSKNDCELNNGDKIIINQAILKVNNYIPWKKKIEVLYEDEDILIVYKPIKMLVHPDGNSNETLVNAVSYYLRDKKVIFEHLHRLDYETSGMIIFSKNIFSHSYLYYLWENHQVKKNYICLCHNKFNKLSGIINKCIGNDRHSNKMVVSDKGKEAITKYSVIENNDISKVDVEIIGGRKHQIRLHLSSINHMIVGDDLYGIRDGSNRMMLEFYKVEFIHPRTKKSFVFEIKIDF